MASPSKWAKENLSCESLPSSGWEASVVMFGQEASLNPTLPFSQCLPCLIHKICTCHLTPEYFYFTTVWEIYIKIGRQKSWIFKRTFQTARASLVAQLVKNLPAMQETWVQSLGWEDPLEKGKATHSNILAWRIPGTIQSMGSQRVKHNWATFTSLLNSQTFSLQVWYSKQK